MRNMRLTERSETTSAGRRFIVLYEGCALPVRAYCGRRVARDRVDDAVAETFVVAWRRLDDVPQGDAALLWLYRVAGNVVRHEWRASGRRRRFVERVADLRVVGADGPAERAVAVDEVCAVRDALGRLDDSDAELLRLVAWEQLTSAEVAAVLEIAPNTASQRISRARKRLAEQFERLDAAPSRRPADDRGGVS